ncbi:MAG TPA: hypothetical protein VFW94_23425 [Candidatus Acidoferrales bacterium]|nr:hypothetical protein [Candidatus Acidoferrales bacterium]
MTADEQLVRDAWEGDPQIQDDAIFGEEDEVLVPAKAWRIFIAWIISFPYADSPEAAWHAAAEFTRHRQEEIRQVEREIALLDSHVDGETFALIAVDIPRPERIARDVATYGRILSRLKSIKADLQRGMKSAQEVQR